MTKLSERLRKHEMVMRDDSGKRVGFGWHKGSSLEHEAADLLDKAEAALDDVDGWHTQHAAGSPEWNDKDVVKCYITIGELRAIRETLAAIRSEGDE